MSPPSPGATRARLRISSAVVPAALLLGTATPAVAEWPPGAGSDGVYGRFRGDTDISLKLGGMVRDSGLAGSVGASIHYYSLLGITGDYSESLVADSLHARSASVGMELRPLFLPRWALGLERGPAWLDLALDSAAFGFGRAAAVAEPGCHSVSERHSGAMPQAPGSSCAPCAAFPIRSHQERRRTTLCSSTSAGTMCCSSVRACRPRPLELARARPPDRISGWAFRRRGGRRWLCAPPAGSARPGRADADRAGGAHCV
jgi:hypothetical protein